VIGPSRTPRSRDAWSIPMVHRKPNEIGQTAYQLFLSRHLNGTGLLDSDRSSLSFQLDTPRWRPRHPTTDFSSCRNTTSAFLLVLGIAMFTSSMR